MESFGGFLTIASGEECKTDGEQRIFSWLWWPLVPGVGNLAYMLADCC